jgi:hypothetical protein
VSDINVSGTALVYLDAATTGQIDVSAATIVQGTSDEVTAIYGSSGFTGLGNEDVWLYPSIDPFDAVTLNAIDAVTTGTVTVYSNGGTLVGSAADVFAAFSSAGISGLGSQNVKLEDASVAAATLNAIDAATDGLIQFDGTGEVTGTALEIATALASAGINGLGFLTLTLSDSTLAASALNSIDAATGGPVDASSATTLTGTASAVAAAYASAGITGLGNEAVTLSDTTLAAATLNTIDAATSGAVDASAATSLTGTAANVAAAYASAGITGLGNEAVTLSDTTLAAATLNAIDVVTSGVVNASAATTLTGTAAAVAASYAANTAGTISGLGNEAVTLSDTSLLAATLNTINSATSGVVNVSAATTLTGTASALQTALSSQINSGSITGLGNEAFVVTGTGYSTTYLVYFDANTTGIVDVSAATSLQGNYSEVVSIYTSSGFSGLGNEDLWVIYSPGLSETAANLLTVDGYTTGTLKVSGVSSLSGTDAQLVTVFADYTGLGGVSVSVSGSSMAAASLNTIDAATSGSVSASAATTVTGTASEVSTAYASAGITGLGNEAVTLSDTTLAAATLNTIDAATSGLVNASAATTLTGTAAAVSAAYASAGITGLGNEAVTLSDTTLAAATLNSIDALTSGLVDGSAAATLAGTAAAVASAYASAGISGLGNEAVTLSDTTLAAGTLNTIYQATTGVIDASAATTLTGVAAIVEFAYILGAQGSVTGLGNEAVALAGSVFKAEDLNVLDGDTSGLVDATSASTIVGNGLAAVALAHGSAGISLSASVSVQFSDTAANLSAQTYAAAGTNDDMEVGVAGASTDLTSLTGFETIILDGSATPANVITVADGAGTTVAAMSATSVVLGGGGQVFIGSAGADAVTGGSGADDIQADDGADTITGGAGHDTINLADGDHAQDVVVINSALNADADTIGFFASGEDVIEFSIAGLGLNAADYAAGAVTVIDAATANALGAGAWSNQVVVDTAANIATLAITAASGPVLAVASDTHNLMWDADGDFSAGLVIVGNAYALLAGDFAIVT